MSEGGKPPTQMTHNTRSLSGRPAPRAVPTESSADSTTMEDAAPDSLIGERPTRRADGERSINKGRPPKVRQERPPAPPPTPVPADDDDDDEEGDEEEGEKKELSPVSVGNTCVPTRVIPVDIPLDDGSTVPGALVHLHTLGGEEQQMILTVPSMISLVSQLALSLKAHGVGIDVSQNGEEITCKILG